jgi:hypothetical protein
MANKKDDILRKLDAPWITKDGFLDWTKFPIDSVLKQALRRNNQDFQSACRILTSMYVAGRTEAAIFLFGLLIYNADDIVRKETVVEALGNIETKESAGLLFRELRLTESSNSTRKYINTILKSLRHFPMELTKDDFERLLKDSKWSHRMKKKFKEFLKEAEYRHWG